MTPPQTVAAYIDALPSERKDPVERLVSTIRTYLPDGFEEIIGYGMPSWVVPHALYPPGYHVDPKLPLPFLAVASQKRHIGLYHMGLYASPPLLDWFVGAYPAHCKTKLDMGKSCVRLKNPANIPYELVGTLCTKMTPSQWIELYETAVKRA